MRNALPPASCIHALRRRALRWIVGTVWLSVAGVVVADDRCIELQQLKDNVNSIVSGIEAEADGIRGLANDEKTERDRQLKRSVPGWKAAGRCTEGKGREIVRTGVTLTDNELQRCKDWWNQITNDSWAKLHGEANDLDRKAQSIGSGIEGASPVRDAQCDTPSGLLGSILEVFDRAAKLAGLASNAVPNVTNIPAPFVPISNPVAPVVAPVAPTPDPTSSSTSTTDANGSCACSGFLGVFCSPEAGKDQCASGSEADCSASLFGACSCSCVAAGIADSPGGGKTNPDQACGRSEGWVQVGQEVWDSIEVTVQGSFLPPEALYRAKEEAENKGRQCGDTKRRYWSPIDAEILTTYLVPLTNGETRYKVRVEYSETRWEKR